MAERDATFSPALANAAGILVAVLAFAACLVPHGLLWGWPSVGRGMAALFALPTFVGVFVAGGLVHEGLHALGFRVAGGVPWSEIRLTIIWRALTPATHCRAAVRAGAYRVTTALPGLVLGVLPAVAGIVSGAGWLSVFAAIMLSLAAGDLLVLLAVRSVPSGAWVIDHPSRVGCRVVDDPGAK